MGGEPINWVDPKGNQRQRPGPGRGRPPGGFVESAPIVISGGEGASAEAGEAGAAGNLAASGAELGLMDLGYLGTAADLGWNIGKALDSALCISKRYGQMQYRTAVINATASLPTRQPLLTASDVVEPGRCTKQRYAELYNEVIRHCPGNGKWGNARGCKGNSIPKDLVSNERRWRSCAKARANILNKCTPKGTTGTRGQDLYTTHKEQLDLVEKAAKNCSDEIARRRGRGLA